MQRAPIDLKVLHSNRLLAPFKFVMIEVENATSATLKVMIDQLESKNQLFKFIEFRTCGGAASVNTAS